MKRKREFWQLFGPLAILYMYKKTNEKSKVVARGRRFDLEGRLEEKDRGGGKWIIYVLHTIHTDFFFSGVQF